MHLEPLEDRRLLDGAVVDALPFERIEPLGGLMAVSRDNAGSVDAAGEHDQFTFFAEGGQTVSAVVRPEDPGAILEVSLAGVSGVFTSPAPGEPAVLPATGITTDAAYAVQVSGDAITPYTLDIYRNASLEAEVGDSGDGNELGIDGSLVELGGGRYGVVGASEPISVDAVVWGVQPASGEILRIDPATGTVLGSFPAPDDLQPQHTRIGLSLAEGGQTLLYINSDVDSTALYRLDPITGAVLSVESTAGASYDGLGFERLGPIETIYSADMDADPGWTLEGGWEFGAPGYPTSDENPEHGFNGPNVIGYDLDGPYPNDMSAEYATTPAIDASGYSDVTLSFRRWLRVYPAYYDRATVEVSTDGTNWITVWENGDEDLRDTSWTLQRFDISAVADGQPTVFVRWGMGPTNSGGQRIGWNLDEVAITGSPAIRDQVFLNAENAEIRRQEGFSGGEISHFTSATPPGAIGGDDVGRQFTYLPGTGIVEFDPRVPDVLVNTLPAPADGIEGLAFDGRGLYASTASGRLYTLAADTGNVLSAVEVPGGALFGLGGLYVGTDDRLVYTDPVGDTFGTAGPPIDIKDMTAELVGWDLVLTVHFFTPIAAPSTGAPEGVAGYLDLDLDQNVGTGTMSHDPSQSGLGVDFFVDLDSEQAHPGLVDLVATDSGSLVGQAPILYGPDYLRVSISQGDFLDVTPPGYFDRPGIVNYGAIVGSGASLTDAAPNTHVATSTRGASAGGRLFVADDYTVREVDPAMGTVLNSFARPGRGDSIMRGMTFDGTSLYFLGKTQPYSLIYQVDPDSGEVIDVDEIIPQPPLSYLIYGNFYDLAALNGKLYFRDYNYPEGRIVQFDPVSDTVIDVVPISESVTQMWRGLGAITSPGSLVTMWSGEGMLEIDPATGNVTRWVNPIPGYATSSITAVDNQYCFGPGGDGLLVADRDGTLLRLLPVEGGTFRYVAGEDSRSATVPELVTNASFEERELVIADVDEYTLDLTGRAGHAVDLVLAGQHGMNFSDQMLRLLDVDATTVLATATPNPTGMQATNDDLAILGFVVPADGVYTLRVESSAEGEYAVVVTESLVFDAEPNDLVARGLDDAGAALGHLGGHDAATDAGAAGYADPSRDNYSPPDVRGVSAEIAGSELVLTMDFFHPIAAASTLAQDRIQGYWDLDLDQDAATGVPSHQQQASLLSRGGELGAEVYVDLRSEAAHPGEVDLFDAQTDNLIGSAPITFTPLSFQVRIPLTLLADDGAVDYSAVVGVIGENWGDAAPNWEVGTSTWSADRPIRSIEPRAQSRLFAVPSDGSGDIVELDPVTGTELNRFAAPQPGTDTQAGLAFDGNSLFYIRPQTSRILYELDPDTGAVIDADLIAEGSGGLDGLAAYDGLVHLLAADELGSPYLLRFDPVNDTLSRTPSNEWPPGVTPMGAMAAIAGPSQKYNPLGLNEYALLVMSTSPSEVLEIDPTWWQDHVLSRFSLQGTALPGLAVLDNQVYVPTQDSEIKVYSRQGDLLRTVPLPYGVSGLAGYDLGPVAATELIENGGFDAADFSGWTAIDNGLVQGIPWTAGYVGSGYDNLSEPLSWYYDAYNGFTGEAGAEFGLYQDVTIPYFGQATLTTNHRIVYDGSGSPDEDDRTFVISIRDTADNVLEELYSETLVMTGEAEADLGWNRQQFDLSDYAGQTIRIHFHEIIGNSTGPAMLELDDISLAVIEPSIDWYQYELTEGETLAVSTQTPFDDPGASLANTLDPALVVVGPSGQTVTTDADSAPDGKNARTEFLAPASGSYRIGVVAESGHGEYLLHAEVPPSLDADLNGAADALTDGVLILRYLFDFSDDALIEDALAPDAARTVPAQIVRFLDSCRDTMLDVDANGAPDALTDGILILRYLFGFTGDALVEDALAPDATRTDPVDISSFLDHFDPNLQSTSPMAPLAVGAAKSVGESSHGRGDEAPAADASRWASLYRAWAVDIAQDRAKATKTPHPLSPAQVDLLMLMPES